MGACCFAQGRPTVRTEQSLDEVSREAWGPGGRCLRLEDRQGSRYEDLGCPHVYISVTVKETTVTGTQGARGGVGSEKGSLDGV